ncbi:GntP family permease [Aerococcus christensenii]|uniref:GntP family permease n=1 Tax=Aerococcus christensenii TaxID=87541 RepID=UPI0023A9584E|nr:GntP family permease [Aerococcus christensenii]WEB71276.1 GntP family permease [Aerococcus christensenii]
MTGIPLVFVFILSIIAMILLISKWKVHPFLAIMLISAILGLLGGIPLISSVGEGGKKIMGLPEVIGAGFSSTFSSIGIVIIFGAMIGTFLEVTGAALKLADMVIKLVGPHRPELAIELMGWVVSIPVFCDSGFVVLNPIRKALVKRTGASSVAMTVCLSAGLYASHVFIPPTPGPIAAANTLGIGNQFLLVMLFGAICSIPALITSYFYAKHIGQKEQARDEADSDSIEKTYEELVAEYGQLPNGFMALAPIIVPILLMALSNIATLAHWKGLGAELCIFFGTPIMALAVGVVLGVYLVLQQKMVDKLYKMVDDTLKVSGPILFVTAAGSVLGKVIASTSLVSFITANANILQSIGILFPFVLSALLKTAQGSSTVALTTTAGIMAPLLPALGLASTISSVLVVMAIGAGAMTVSHANDSYFWVVTNFGQMTPNQGYRTQTVVTLIEGISSMALIFVLSLFLH